MTITTTGTPWPTRRDREGGPTRTPVDDVVCRAMPAYVPRHAAAEPDVATRLAVVVPAQRTAGTLAPRRPAPSPCPPRPAVGSAVHDVADLPRLRSARNGFGVAAACLGVIGLPLGLAPVTGFAAAGLGLIAVVLGIAGRFRARSGAATNSATAVTGAVLGLIALGLGVVGAVTFLRSPDRLAYDLDALTAPPASVSTIGE